MVVAKGSLFLGRMTRSADGVSVVVQVQILNLERSFCMDDRKVIIIGERDGIPGPTIAECLEASGREIVFQKTECFV